MRHYHVMLSVPGYLPMGDMSEQFVTRSRREAADALTYEKKRLQDETPSLRFSGEARKDLRYDIDDGSLGMVLEAAECFEEACLVAD